MAVQNIECQIAQGQITRYLAGDSFSPDTAVELRSHIADCSDCAAVLESKKAILMGMLQGQTVHAAVQIPDREEDLQQDEVADGPQTPKNPLTQRVIGLLGGQKVRQAPIAAQKLESGPSTAGYWKPLLYSGALGLVLFLMSFVLRDPTRFFGERALENGGPAAASIKPEVKTAANSLQADPSASGTGSEVAAQPPGTGSNPTEGGDAKPAGSTGSEGTVPSGTQAQPKSDSAKPSPSTASTAPKTAGAPSKSPANSTTRRSTGSRRPAAPATKPQGIKVYDAQGNPIS